MRVRTIQPGDATAWERMRQTFWPAAPGEHAGEIASFLARNRVEAGVSRPDSERSRPAEVLFAEDEDGRPIGFAELSIRPYAEECYSGRVAYLEGWWVEPDARGRGVGAALVAAAEAWARAEGCTEMASDTGIDNPASAAAHRALGFTEVARIVCFRKPLI